MQVFAMTKDLRAASGEHRMSRSRSRACTWCAPMLLALMLCSCQCIGSTGSSGLPPAPEASGRTTQHGTNATGWHNLTRGLAQGSGRVLADSRHLLQTSVENLSAQAPLNMSRRRGRRLLYHRRSVTSLVHVHVNAGTAGLTDLQHRHACFQCAMR